jgi:TRAP-type C4-dicarboxylate transport system substrate-binding protein
MKAKQLIITFGIILFLVGMIFPVTAVTAADKFTLKYWNHQPETAWQAQIAKRYIADVKEKTNGRVILHPYWASSLVSGKEATAGIKGGIIDIAQLQTFNTPGEFPVSDVAGLPFIVKDPREVIEGLRKLYEEGLMPEYDGKGFKLLDFHAPGMMYALFREKKVDTLAGFKGLKIRGSSPVSFDMVKAFGAAPIALASTDLYMSLDRGVIDGLLSSPGFMAPFKLYEVSKYFLDQPLFAGNMFFAMNQKTWDKLPPDLQKIMMECTKTMTEDWIKTSDEFESVKSKKVLKDNGIVFYPLAPGELEKFKSAVKPVTKNFIKKMDSLGFDGQKIVDTFVSVQTQ